MYYRIRESYEEDSYTDATVTNMRDIMHFKVTSTLELGKSFPVLNVKVDSENSPGDYFMSGPFLIISSEVRNIFDKHNCKFEYFDVVVNHNGNVIEQGCFYFAHILCEKSFIDKDESIYSLDDDYIDEISKLVINNDSIAEESIVSLAKSFELVLIVNESLANEIIEKKITGVELERVCSKIN